MSVAQGHRNGFYAPGMSEPIPFDDLHTALTESRADRKREFVMAMLAATCNSACLSDRIQEAADAFELLEKLSSQTTGEG